MTEDEARQKWCPFVRLSAQQDTSHAQGYCWNNRGDDTHDANCIASDCMAWREAGEAYVPCAPTEEGFTYVAAPAGYCGLAGKP